MKTDFSPFKVGTVFNPLGKEFANVTPKVRGVEIKYPSRLNAMAIDPSKITSNKNMVYTPGEVLFSIGIYKTVKVELNSNNNLEIDQDTKRKQLVRHAYLLMKHALGFSEGLTISVDNSSEIRHAGLGSSSGLIASVAAAINELYGNPISARDLVKYLAQNHGEEIDGVEESISPVQCIGGSAASGFFEGGFLIVAGESRVIKAMNLDDDYTVVIGIPNDYAQLDSEVLLEKEMSNFDKFMATGKKYGPTIAYNILHYGLPGMEEKNIKPMGDIIFEYRFKMGSIENCSFCYPPMVQIAKQLEYLKTENTADVLAISSVGPAFFAITKNPEKCKEAFEKVNLAVFNTMIENGTYTVIEKEEF